MINHIYRNFDNPVSEFVHRGLNDNSYSTVPGVIDWTKTFAGQQASTDIPISNTNSITNWTQQLAGNYLGTPNPSYTMPTSTPNPAPNPAPAPSGGGKITADQALKEGKDINVLRSQGLLDEGSGGGSGLAEWQNQIKSQIEGGYNEYFAQLDAMMNTDLPAQKTAQEGIVASQKQQAENTLGSQQTQGLSDLAAERSKTEANQTKGLQSLAEDIRNQFKAGQIYLGARGAGDSSAANQYAYAIAKMGTKARGTLMDTISGIQNEINQREFKLKNTYNTELNNLTEQANQKTLSIAQWFSEQQSALRQAKAQGSIEKGQSLANFSLQLLQTATQQLMMAQQEAANRRSMLEQWAMNNSTTINELKSNMANISAYSAPKVQPGQVAGQISTSAQGDISTPFWSTNYKEENKV